MSDHFIVIVPRNATHIPSREAQLRVMEILRRLAPSAAGITSEASAAIRFHDCGGNFEAIHCPGCAADISLDWWQQRMDEDFDGEGFRLGAYSTPCCGTSVSLNELVYDWPQAFGRFNWTIENPDIGELDAVIKSELEVAADISLMAIHRLL